MKRHISLAMSILMAQTALTLSVAAPAAAQDAAPQSFEEQMLALDPTAALNGPAEAIENGLKWREQAGSLEQNEALSPAANSNLARYLAEGYFFNNDYIAAHPYFEEALDHLTTNNLAASDEAELLRDRISANLSAMGRLDEALTRQIEALAMKEERHGRMSDLYSAGLYSLALTNYRMGDLETTAGRIAESWDIRKQLPPPEDGSVDPNMAIYGMSLGAVYNQMGRLEEGLDATREAALWADANLPDGHIVTPAALHNLGGLLNSSGWYAEAEGILRRTLEIRIEAIGEDKADTGLTMGELAYSLQYLGQLEEAEALLAASAQIIETNFDSASPHQAPIIWLNAANMAFDRDAFDVAFERQQRAIALLEEHVPEGHIAYARAYLGLGKSLHQQGRPAEAIEKFRQSTAISAEQSEPYEVHRLNGEFTLAKALIGSGENDEGMALAKSAYDAARTQLLSSIITSSSRLRTTESYKISLSQFAQIAFRAGLLEDGIEALQLARFGDLDKSSRDLAMRYAVNDPTGAELARQLQDSVDQSLALRQAGTAAIVADDPQAEAQARLDLAKVEARISTLQDELDLIFPGYSEAARPAPIPLSQIQAGLGDREALLMVQPTLEGLLSVVITSDDVISHESGAGSVELFDAVQSIRQSIEIAPFSSDPDFPFAASFAVHQAIFSPEILRALEGRNALRVLADGYAASLPFALLTNSADPETAKNNWLVERFAISTPLSLTDLPRSAKASDGPMRLAGIGAPALAPPIIDGPIIDDAGSGPTMLAMLRGSTVDISDLRQLPSLPGAAKELRLINAAITNPDNSILTGEAATEQAVRAMDLGDFDMLVFATHGLVSGEISGLAEPALVLTPPEAGSGTNSTENDGLLTASEIATLRLNAEWVILSACNTAAGSGRGAPNYSGLARAFVHAGARSLLLSHWQVRDDAAAFLTTRTVELASGGESKAQALRTAQLELMKDTEIAGAWHPAVWAPFILIGD